MKKATRKLRLHAQTLQTLGTNQLQAAQGGMPHTGNLTDVPPNCGTFNC